MSFEKNSFAPFFVGLSVGVIASVITVLYVIKKLVTENSRISDKMLLFSGKASFIIYITIFALLIIIDYTLIAQNNYYYGMAVIMIYLSYFFGLTFCALTIIKFLKWYQQDREFRILGYLVTTSALFALIVFQFHIFLSIRMI
jgi:hypothetical protein